MTYDVESPGPGMAQAQTCGGANSVNGGTNSPHLDNWTSNDNKQTMNKNTLIRFHSKRPHTIIPSQKLQTTLTWTVEQQGQ